MVLRTPPPPHPNLRRIRTLKTVFSLIWIFLLPSLSKKCYVPVHSKNYLFYLYHRVCLLEKSIHLLDKHAYTHRAKELVSEQYNPSDQQTIVEQATSGY